MAAVDELLQHLSSMDSAIDLIANGAVSSPHVQEHVARGVAVHGLVCVEMFLSSRIDEWSAALTAARVPPSHLPGGTKQFEDRVVEVFPRALKDTGPGQRSSLLDDVGKSLTSLSSGTLIASPLALRWSKTNVQSADIEEICSFFGAERSKVWSELTSIWSGFDPSFPGNTSLKKLFEQVAQYRHDAAHSNSPNLPIPNLLTLTRDVRRICVCIDTLASCGLMRIRSRPPSLSTSAPVRGSTIGVRKIVQDRGKWPEFAPGVKRAQKRHGTLPNAMTDATIRARPKGELVLALSDKDEIVNWCFPL